MHRTVALYDYAADPADPEQLSLHAGEELSMGEDAGSGWIYVTNSFGKVGIVPASYLSPVAAAASTPAVAATEATADVVNAASPVVAVTEAPLAAEPQPTEAAEPAVPSQPPSDPRYAKYERMRKAGLPEGAIRNAMQRDKVDPGNFFGASNHSGGDTTNGGGTSSAESYDPAIAKYKRMEKAGLPEGAIRNAMARDGVDSSLMYGGPPQAATGTPSRSSGGGASGSPGGDSLAEQLKMKKLHVTPTTPPKQAAVASTGPSPTAAVKSETSPFDEVKKRALERQKRLEASGELLTEEKSGGRSGGGAQYSPPDKSQWKANLKRSEVQQQPRSAETANKPNWRANLHKVPEKPVPDEDASKKRTQEDAEVATTEPKPAPQYEKTGEPCSNYQVNTAAAQFDECRCGHPKSAHGAAKKSEDASLAKGVQRASSSSEHRETPCNNYRLDTTAARFGDCKCGHPKADHGKQKPSAVNNASPPSRVEPVVSKPQTPEKAPQPCGNYRLNVTAQTFGDCLCGHSKAVHVTTPKGASAAATSVTASPSPQAGVEKSEKPCSTFRVDKKGEFGMCVCGHSKADHEIRPKATTERALSSPSSAKEKQSPSTPANEPCSTFKVDLSASGFGICVCGHPRSEHGKPQRHAKSDPSESRAEASLQFDEAKPTKKASSPCESFSLDMKADRFGVCKCGLTKAEHGAKRKTSLEAAAASAVAMKADDDADEWADSRSSNAQNAVKVEEKGDQVSGEASQPSSATSVPEQARGEDTQEGSPKPNKIGENVELQTRTSNEAAPAGEPSQVGSPRRAAPPPPGPGSPRRAAPPPPTVSSNDAQAAPPATSNQPRRSAPPPPIDAEANKFQPSNEPPAQSSTSNQPRKSAPPPPAEAASNMPLASGQAPSPRPVRAAPPLPKTAEVANPPIAMRAPPPPPAAEVVNPPTSTGGSMRAPRPPPAAEVVNPPVSTGGSMRAPPPPPGIAPQQGYAPFAAANPGVQPGIGGPTHFRQPPPPPNVSDTGFPPSAIPRPAEVQQGRFMGNIPYAQAVPQPQVFQQQMGGRNQQMMPPPPPAVQQQQQQQQPPPGRKWMCSRCTFENEPQALACLICELPRTDLAQQTRPAPQQLFNAPYPAQGAQPAMNRQPMMPPSGMRVMREWNCAACTYLNPPLNLKCEICESPRPPESQRPPAQQQQQQQTPSTNPFQSFW